MHPESPPGAYSASYLNATSFPAAVFAKPPIPGETKTRLTTLVSNQDAARLHRAFILDTLEKFKALVGVRVCLWKSRPSAELDEIALHAGVETALQSTGDLGARMTQSLQVMLQKQGAGLLVGTDTPTLPKRILSMAIEALRDAPLVFGPSADGGFYLVAARDSAPRFERVRWSSPHTLSDVLATRSARLLPPWYDIDRPSDLRLLRTQLAIDKNAAPCTAQTLSEIAAEP